MKDEEIRREIKDIGGRVEGLEKTEERDTHQLGEVSVPPPIHAKLKDDCVLDNSGDYYVGRVWLGARSQCLTCINLWECMARYVRQGMHTKK